MSVCKTCGGTSFLRARKGKRSYMKARAGWGFRGRGGTDAEPTAPVHSLRVYYRTGAGRNGRYHACPDCTSPPSFDALMESFRRARKQNGKVAYSGVNLHDHPEELTERAKNKARREKAHQSKARR